MAAEGQFRLFGDRSRFALEVCLAVDQPNDAVPRDSMGSWGAWRLYIADVNLCRLQFDTEAGMVEMQEVRWFLAPLVRWLVASWMPMLHEAHLPDKVGWGDRRPRWARLAYLAMIERSGDDIEHFRPWQLWGARHALRFAAEGGIVPDLFFQRVGDEIEISWGDRIQPGSENAAFLVEEGVARASVKDVAEVFKHFVNWFFNRHSIRKTEWSRPHVQKWREIETGGRNVEPLYWYLDSKAEQGPRSRMLIAGLAALGKKPPKIEGSRLDTLSPEIAMFGDLSPKITPHAAVTLLIEYYDACTSDPEPEELVSLQYDEPAWTTTSPWENGYSLALDVLAEADPDPKAPATEIEALLDNLAIEVRDVGLGEEGPRGVALAGPGLRPTILVNTQHVMNRENGRRFTLSHEFCHILFDRRRARSLAHGSGPWASTSVEQRANAFAAMLLMPPARARQPIDDSPAASKHGVAALADTLRVSLSALRRHLVNLGEIDASDPNE